MCVCVRRGKTVEGVCSVCEAQVEAKNLFSDPRLPRSKHGSNCARSSEQ